MDVFKVSVFEAKAMTFEHSVCRSGIMMSCTVRYLDTCKRRCGLFGVNHTIVINIHDRSV